MQNALHKSCLPGFTGVHDPVAFIRRIPAVSTAPAKKDCSFAGLMNAKPRACDLRYWRAEIRKRKHSLRLGAALGSFSALLAEQCRHFTHANLPSRNPGFAFVHHSKKAATLNAFVHSLPGYI